MASSSTGTQRANVVIIGAGISGLSAARLLVAKGLNVVVLEARDRVGGRTYTIRDASFKYTDLGGAYVGPTQRRVARLAQELGLEFYKVNTRGKTILRMAGTYLQYRGTDPPMFNPIKLFDISNVMQVLDKYGKQVPADAPWKAARAKEWDAMTVKEFLDSYCWTTWAKKAVEIMVKTVLCMETHEVSLLYWLWYISCGQGIRRLIYVKNGAQERKFVGGAMQLSEKMADEIGDRVKLSHPVTKVEEVGEVLTVHTSNGQKFQGDYVISAMPQTLLGQVTFNPALSPMKQQMIQRIPMGSIIKTMTFYEDAFWREKGFCGEMATTEGPVIYCVDDTKPDGTVPCIMGFILSDQARELIGLTPEQRKEIVVKHYAEVFKDNKFLKPTNYIEKNWVGEEYSGGCYVSAMPPGVLTGYGHLLREPHGKVHFAGTESATYWMGYMEGAIESGERAAKEILHNMGKLPAEKIFEDEPPVTYFPDGPINVLAIERYLPSVTQFLLACATLVALGAALLTYRFIN